MPLVTTAELVTDAASRGTAVGAFNVITLEHIEGVIAGAEIAGVAVLLQVSQNAVGFHDGALAPIAAAAVTAASVAKVAVALHLDHVTSIDLLKKTADVGFSSAMFDAGLLPFDENVARTVEAADWAHANGLWLEAEIGYIGGKPGQLVSAHSTGARTDPDEAARFARLTRVDGLAIAVGSAHAMTSRTAAIDHDLIGRIADVVTVPLVLHGSSGVANDDITRAIAAGIRKVNVGTALNVAYTSAVRMTLALDPHLVDPRSYLSPARDRISEAVASVLRLVDA